MPVTLAGKLPATDKNGLDDTWAERLTAEPDAAHLVVGVVRTSKVTTNIETGENIPTVHFVHVEICDHEHPYASQVREVVESLFGERTGKWPLPRENA